MAQSLLKRDALHVPPPGLEDTMVKSPYSSWISGRTTEPLTRPCWIVPVCCAWLIPVSTITPAARKRTAPEVITRNRFDMCDSYFLITVFRSAAALIKRQTAFEHILPEGPREGTTAQTRCEFP